VVELCVAAALVAIPGRRSASAAVALMTLLNSGLAVRVLRGEAGDCGCFGRPRHASVGWHTVVRNMLLAAAAVFLYASAVH
jgi:hypothetical protein